MRAWILSFKVHFDADRARSFCEGLVQGEDDSDHISESTAPAWLRQIGRSELERYNLTEFSVTYPSQDVRVRCARLGWARAFRQYSNLYCYFFPSQELTLRYVLQA